MEYKVAVKRPNGNIIKEYNLEDHLIFSDVLLPNLILDKQGTLDVYGEINVYETEYFRLVMSYSRNGYRSEEEYLEVTDPHFSFQIQTNVKEGTFVNDVESQFRECQKIADWLNKKVLPDIRSSLLNQD